jgi:hypothetical protein
MPTVESCVRAARAFVGGARSHDEAVMGGMLILRLRAHNQELGRRGQLDEQKFLDFVFAVLAGAEPEELK